MTGANHGPRSGPDPRNEHAVRLFRTATLICAVAVAWLAFRPAVEVEAGLPWDKANHASAFAVLTFLAGRGWPRLSPAVLVLIMLAAGIGVELVQGVPQVGRDADAWDVVADAVGIALGWAVLRAGRRRSGLRE